MIIGLEECSVGLTGMVIKPGSPLSDGFRHKAILTFDVPVTEEQANEYVGGAALMIADAKAYDEEGKNTLEVKVKRSFKTVYLYVKLGSEETNRIEAEHKSSKLTIVGIGEDAKPVLRVQVSVGFECTDLVILSKARDNDATQLTTKAIQPSLVYTAGEGSEAAA